MAPNNFPCDLPSSPQSTDPLAKLALNPAHLEELGTLLACVDCAFLLAEVHGEEVSLLWVSPSFFSRDTALLPVADRFLSYLSPDDQALVTSTLITAQQTGIACCTFYSPAKPGYCYHLRSAPAPEQGAGAPLVLGILTKKQEASLTSDVSSQQASQLHLAERDRLTGLLNKQGFFRRVREQLDVNGAARYWIVRIDIDDFKALNDILGVEAGDALLRDMASALCRHSPPNSITARLEADHFVVFLPVFPLSVEAVFDPFFRWFSQYALDFTLVSRMGVYEVKNPAIDVSIMCDRALLALRSIKGDLTRHMATYDESMRQQMLQEQSFRAQLRTALDRHQFLLYLQPQYDLISSQIVGAEALVRWNHPTRGILPPSQFIPIMEQNHLITQLDLEVAEMTCALLKKWQEAGHAPLSLAVNISRRDIYEPTLCEKLCALTDQYGVPRRLLRLEITESAYVDSPHLLFQTISQLKSAGFLVEMDDFGSGYSSLNSLKNMPVDIIKLDLKFLEMSQENSRGGVILNSVVQMAHWLDIQVLAEGVETPRQAAYLKSIDCRLAQGYLFSQPIPVAQFEQLISATPFESLQSPPFLSRFFRSQEFWNPDAQATVIFHTFVGAAGIFEYYKQTLLPQRLNDRFFELTGLDRQQVRENFLSLLHFDDRAVLLSRLDYALTTEQEVNAEARWLLQGPTGPATWLQLKIRCIGKRVSRCLLYIGLEDITPQKNLQEQLHVKNQELRLAMAQMGRTICEYDIASKTLITPPSYAARHGIPSRLENIPSQKLPLVLPEDHTTYRDFYEALLQGAPQSDAVFRVHNADGTISWEHHQAVTIFNKDGTPSHAVILVEDFTKQYQQDLLLNRLSVSVAPLPPSVSYNAPILERVFQLLYASNGSDEAIQTVLESLGQFFQVSRAYVIEDSTDHRFCTNTFAWCDDEIPSSVALLTNYPYNFKDGVNTYLSNFNRYWVFDCTDISTIHPDYLELFQSQGIFSTLQSAILDCGTFMGFVGFDECRSNRQWTAEQRGTLMLASRIIGIFLVQRRHGG